MARNKGGLGPGAMKMGGPGAKPKMPSTAMAKPPSGGPMGGGPSPLAGSLPPVGGGMKKGGKVEHKKHARGGVVAHAKGGVVSGGDSKARHHGSGSFK